jgi:hypothetical protein
MGATDDAALLLAACRCLGLDPAELDEEITVIVRYKKTAHRIRDRPTVDLLTGSVVVLPRLPANWQRILDILAGAGEELSQVEIQRRFRKSHEGDRAYPEVALRIVDMQECGLIEPGARGYRPCDGRH